MDTKLPNTTARGLKESERMRASIGELTPWLRKPMNWGDSMVLTWRYSFASMVDTLRTGLGIMCHGRHLW